MLSVRTQTGINKARRAARDDTPSYHSLGGPRRALPLSISSHVTATWKRSNPDGSRRQRPDLTPARIHRAILPGQMGEQKSDSEITYHPHKARGSNRGDDEYDT